MTRIMPCWPDMAGGHVRKRRHADTGWYVSGMMAYGGTQAWRLRVPCPEPEAHRDMTINHAAAACHGWVPERETMTCYPPR